MLQSNFKILLFSLLFSSSFMLQAQVWDNDNSGKVLLLNFGYGLQIPMADLADRFNRNWAPEVSFDYMTKKNWIFGLQTQYLFGNDVKEDVLVNLRTEQGDIIGNDRSPADIYLRERGFYLGLRVGRLFTMSENNPRSGIRINFGVGLLQHWIRIQDDPFRDVPQLSTEYKKGYDRLTNGLTLHQFIGYQLIGKGNGMNFTGGFEFFEGFTQNRRSINFDTQMQDTNKRLDILSGFKLSFTLPFYIGNGDEIYY